MSTTTISTTNPKLIIAEYYDLLVNQVNVYARELLEKYDPLQDLNETRKLLSPLLRQIVNNRIRNRFAAAIDNKSKNNDDDDDDQDEEMFEIDWYNDPYSEAFRTSSQTAAQQTNTEAPTKDAANETSDDSSDKFSSSRTIRDYVNDVKSSMIDELRQAEKASLESYERKKSTIDIYIDVSSGEGDDEVSDEFKSMLFVPEFCFLLRMEYFSASEKIENPNIFKLYAVFVDFYMSSRQLDLLW